MTASKRTHTPKWHPSPIDLELMHRHFSTSRTQDLADALGVNYNQIACLARKLGLRKDEAWLNSPASGRTDGRKGLGTRFQPGQAGWNKGKKMGPDWCKATQFRPGQLPHNFVPIGSLRVAGGYLQRKTGLSGYPPADWQAVHRLVWTAAHGPIPAGHVIAFIDGRPRLQLEEITLDVLECISKADHARRYSVHRYGPEVAAVHRLRGQITRQIRKAQRAEETA